MGRLAEKIVKYNWMGDRYEDKLLIFRNMLEMQENDTACLKLRHSRFYSNAAVL